MGLEGRGGLPSRQAHQGPASLGRGSRALPRGVIARLPAWALPGPLLLVQMPRGLRRVLDPLSSRRRLTLGLGSCSLRPQTPLGHRLKTNYKHLRATLCETTAALHGSQFFPRFYSAVWHLPQGAHTSRNPAQNHKGGIILCLVEH